MKKLLFIVFILINTVSFSQDYNSQWKDVIKNEIEGKTKSASQIVDEIYINAKRKKDDEQIIKCFFYKSKFLQVFDENANTQIINNLKLEINNSKDATQSILKYVYATILEKYYISNKYNINSITKIANYNNNDYLTWSSNDFESEINKIYSEILLNEKDLRQKSIKNYKAIFDFSPYTDTKNYSLYEFLMDKISSNYLNKMNLGNYHSKSISDSFFIESNEFIKIKTDTISNINLKKIIEIYQNNEDYYLKNNTSNIDVQQFKRMEKLANYSKNKVAYYFNLHLLEKKTNISYLKQNLRYKRAENYFNKTSKNSEKNYYNQVLLTVDSILNFRENPNAKADAEDLKSKILKKEIAIKLPSTLYPNQNYRAFVEFKNIDTLKISYYKIPVKLYQELGKYDNYNYNTTINKDSLIIDYVIKNNPFKVSLKVLPAKIDYHKYSCNLLMDNLDSGSYLLFFEVKNQFASNVKTAFAHHLLLVSNIEFVQDSDVKNDLFYLLDRKTGKPLENVIGKNETETNKSDKNGKIAFNKSEDKTNQNFNTNLIFIKDIDTLTTQYYKSIKYSKENEDQYNQAKAMVFFDRGIYRPGQKLFYKGFIIQNKRKEKNIVPFLTVHVTIEDADETTLKEFDVQTNEFGSFSGEFDIPKNILTGEFKMLVQEPDNYKMDSMYYNLKEDEHSFWDNADYDDYTEFTFKVEEYKRPTFEITFNEIKENYTIGDKIIVTGNAKTLAGSNLTNLKVSFTVSKFIEAGIYYDNNDLENVNFINTQTTTDENGNFKIEFSAIQENVSNDKIDSIIYNINVSITDLNGETKTANSSINIGNKMLQLNCFVKPQLNIEDKNILFIKATTLNNYPLNTKGTIKFIELSDNKYLINNWDFPEINTIKKDDFIKLFPFETYSKDETKLIEKEVYTLNFDTEKSTEIDLSFLKYFNLTNYKIIISTVDKNDNLIEQNLNFELKSLKSKAKKDTFFTYNFVEDKNNFIYEFYSILPDLYITTRIYNDSNKQDEKIIQLKNGYGIVTFPKSNNYKDDVNFHFFTQWENYNYVTTTTIAKEEIQTKLDFEIVSMRNKIEPGSKENWSFRIKNSKLESEVLANMYDSSLDQFAKSLWNEATFYNYNNVNYPNTNNNYPQGIEFNNLYFTSKYFKNYIAEPEIKWFGFDFVYPNNTYYNAQYLRSVNPIVNIPKNAKMIYGVISDTVEPLPSANIVVKGTTRKTQTDFDGNFQIEAEKGEVLEISFAGYEIKNIVLENNRNLNVTLKEETSHLDEVVVTGFGIKKEKKALGYATSSIIVESYDDSSEVLMGYLSGKVAGVNIVNSTGLVGSGSQIILRGLNSVNSNNNALIVIDGIPFDNNNMSTIKQEDIESISILKAASATALYGSKAANGVIIITTKKGNKELEQVKTRTNFNETAFFYPNLTTDADGKINFSFTTPESLTKWKLRLFAQNKKAESGYFQTDVISQKDIMIMANMPRFLREKDTINIAAKIVNMTHETKSGNAILFLYDATNDNPIDAITMNNNNSKSFNCKPKDNVAVNWLITIPEGIQAIRYKVIAKSGNISDGEENILPILSNKILVTQSIPIWIKANTNKEFTINNLKNNTSSTLINQGLTIEYTSNPMWFAIQSLPYLMTYEHECAEQTFARYYANCIAEKIINTNPKIEKLFSLWKDKKTPKSKLELNQELKSIILAETPWLLDAQSEDEKNKKMALLFDLNNLKDANDETFNKLVTKQLPSGGFSWFDGGNENQLISQHILAGIGHLNTLFPKDKDKYKLIITKGIPNLDLNFISFYTKNNKIVNPTNSQLHYLYTRSFYLNEYPVSKKCDSLIQLQLKHCKENWLDYSLYKKTLLALAMNRFNEKEFAKNIVTNLRETVSNNDDIGMNWIENKNGNGWYESAIETQALLIEAFAEIDKNIKEIDAMKVWLIKNKQTNNWQTTKSTTEAIYSLISQGNDWTSIKENTKIKIGNDKTIIKKIDEKADEQETGYLKLQLNNEEINSKTSTILIENNSKISGYGGIYWHYFENLEKIKKDSTSTLSIDKKIFKKVKITSGEELIELEKQSITIGDLLTIRLVLKTSTDIEFVHLKDLRASCFEPVDVISNYNWKNNLSYYKSTKDVSTNFFFDKINKGTYVLEYDVRVTNSGNFNSGISTLQSMYSPEYSTHSENINVKVSK